MLWRLTVDIYEKAIGEGYPVVRHQFFGKSQEEAAHYYASHLQTCPFLSDCVSQEQWEQVECSTNAFWDKVKG